MLNKSSNSIKIEDSLIILFPEITNHYTSCSFFQIVSLGIYVYSLNHVVFKLRLILHILFSNLICHIFLIFILEPLIVGNTYLTQKFKYRAVFHCVDLL